MATIHHSNLTNALYIDSSDKNLYIVTELANCDLAKKTRQTRSGDNPAISIETLRSWAYGLAKGLKCLHLNRIIHGDIKASNCLFYDSLGHGTVKLTDYTLSVMVCDDKPMTHTIGTSTHRPPEVFTNSQWSYPSDIWSLACTFYEIAYQELLFPYQGKKEATSETEQRRRSRIRAMKCIHDFGQRHPLGSQNYGLADYVDSDMKTGDFIPVQFHPNTTNKKYGLFNELLFKMLLPANKRLTIDEVLDHPFFGGITTKIKYTIVSTPVAAIDTEESRRVKLIIDSQCKDLSVCKLALELYGRCIGMKNITADWKIFAAIRIADKLLNPVTGIKLNVNRKELISAECQMCTYLNYRLHTSCNVS